MTEAEVLERLRDTPRDWQIVHGRYIRRSWPESSQCPLSSLADERVNWMSVVAKNLGIDDAVEDRIIAAADASHDHDPALRQQLLDACGIR